MIPTLLKKIEAQYSMQKTLNPDGSSSTVKCYFDAVHLIREQHRLLMGAKEALQLYCESIESDFIDGSELITTRDKVCYEYARKALNQLEESNL